LDVSLSSKLPAVAIHRSNTSQCSCLTSIETA